MTNSSIDSFRIPLEQYGLIIRIRKLNPEDAKDTMNILIRNVLTPNKPISLDSYKKKIIELFLLDKIALKKVVQDKDDFVEILYNNIVHYFPEWTYINVCNISNRLMQLYKTKDAVLKAIDNITLDEAKTVLDEISDKEDNEYKLATKAALLRLEKTLKHFVVGQDQAIESVVNNLKLKIAGFKSHASFIFNGPSGRGKGLLAEVLAEEYSGNFWKVSCASYGDERTQKASLMGAPPGYVNGQEDSVLKQKSDKGNNWVILFDEIDKAPDKLFDFFLELLEEGKATDSKGHVCDFSNSIFIFAANEGYTDLRVGESKGLGFSTDASKKVTLENSKEEVEKALRKKWPDEFIGRVDDLILFNPLSEVDISEIVKIELDEVPVQQTSSLISYISQNGFDERYGARGLKKFIEKNVTTRVAEAMLEGLLPNNGLYLTEIANGKVKIIDVHKENKKETFDASAVANTTLQALDS